MAYPYHTCFTTNPFVYHVRAGDSLHKFGAPPGGCPMQQPPPPYPGCPMVWTDGLYWTNTDCTSYKSTYTAGDGKTYPLACTISKSTLGPPMYWRCFEPQWTPIKPKD